ncbi:hypothetical protein ONZ45_g12528 [Pleurotus djamor]|nr:hypothetical protein ONZ45_g12528 [Pleurotus djamor]
MTSTSRNQHQGLSREIRSVLSTPTSWSSSEATSSSSSWWIPNVGPHTTGLLGNWRWLSELMRYIKGIWAALRGIFALAWAKLRGHDLSRNKLHHHRAGDHALAINPPQHNRSKDRGSSWEDEVYERFLSGDVEGDDEDDEWTGDSPSSDSDDDRPIGGLYSRSSSVDATSEAMSLYSDWLPLSATSSSSSQLEGTPSPSEELGSSGGIPAPVLLAHLTHSGSSPLTRRAYDQLLDATLVQSTRTRRKAKSPQQSDEAHRNCVIDRIYRRIPHSSTLYLIAAWLFAMSVGNVLSRILVLPSTVVHAVVECYSRIFIP